MLNIFIIGNGIYDIICAICILYFPDTPLARLHPDIFTASDELNKRLLAYWIFTYGIIRTFSSEKMITCATYLIESFVYLQELHIHYSTDAEKSIFVYVSCILIAYAIYRYI
jgi:hypothetical protein